MKFGRFLPPFLATLIVFQAACASSADLETRIAHVLNHPLLRSAKVAVRAELLDSHQILFSKNSKIPMIPASNLKLLTSGCALLDLGPQFRFKTEVVGKPIGSSGELTGDLILRASGDPTWNKDFYPKPITPLLILAQKLKETGLRAVHGDVVVDDTLFDREFTGKGWKARYQWEEYASEVAAASINRNAVDVTVFPGDRIGAPARVALFPPNHALTIINRVTTIRGTSNVRISRIRQENRVTVVGRINIYHPGMHISFNIHNPPTLVASAFAEVLKEHGIAIRGRARVIDNPNEEKYAHLTSLAEIESPTLLAIVHRLDKESDNFLAEHLFRALGARAYGTGSIQNGAKAITGCLASLGLTEAPISLADGSGLSEEDRVSALTLVRLLEGIAALPVGNYLRDSLPRGGIDGTLEDRLKDVRVQAKTGAIRGVNSLSGYLVNHNGKTVVFSILINDFQGSSDTARDFIDSIVRILASAS